MQPILMHVCCGPCASAPLEIMRDENIPATVLYYNPNIQPEEEYTRRFEALKGLVSVYQIQILEGLYDPQSWEDSIGDYAGVFPLVEGSSDFTANRELRRMRCRCCYKLRFSFLMQRAIELGYEKVSTSLSISPYQFREDMEEIFSLCADRAGVTSIFKDFSDLYPRSIELSRSLGLYRQNYCGCNYSKIEAKLEKQARRNNKNQGQRSM